MSKWEKPQQMENRYRPYLCVLIPLFVLHTSRETQNQTGRKTNYTYTTTATHYWLAGVFLGHTQLLRAWVSLCGGRAWRGKVGMSNEHMARFWHFGNCWKLHPTSLGGVFFLSSVNFLRTVVVHWAAKGTKVERMRGEDFLIFRMTHNLHGANGKIKW